MQAVKKWVLTPLVLLALMALALFMDSLPQAILLLAGRLESWLLYVLAALVILLSLAFLYAMWRGYSARDQLASQERSFGLKDLGFALLYWLIGRVVVVLTMSLKTLVSGQVSTANDQAIANLTKNFAQAPILMSFLFLFTLCVIAPIGEELAFRGFPMVSFFKQHRLIGGLVTSFLFALVHIAEPMDLLVYGSLGLVLFAAYQRRGNIRDSMAVHFLNNLPAALFMIISYFFKG